MAAEIDETDVYILRALLEDGRSPYSKIARSLVISTPTVQARIRRMMEMGLIKKFAPIIDADRLSDNITVLITADADFHDIDRVCETLSDYDEVREVYLTSGEHNLIMKVVVGDMRELYEFQQQKLSKIDEVKPYSSFIVTKTVKEEQRARLEPGMGIKLRCETCKAEIKGKPIVLRIDDRPHFFCCKLCAGAFKKRFKK
ncbi:MAG: Lrp/AsnC ligand binding domain-containing protein [Candidatus Bathyarchaeia archaeon]